MKVKDIMVEPISIDKSSKLSNAMDLMEKHDTRRLLVTHNEDISGVVTMRDIARKLGTWKKGNLPASSLHVATAANEAYTKVLPDMDVQDAIIIMDKKGGVLVVTENNGILGWVTPHQILEKLKVINGYAAEAMRDPITISPSERVAHARRLMLDKDIGRLPVVEGDKIVGIVTDRDIAKAMAAFRDLVADNQQDERIRNLVVGDIMTRNVKCIRTNTSLRESVDIMIKENIGGLPVLNLKDELVGVLSRRGIIGCLAKKGRGT